MELQLQWLVFFPGRPSKADWRRFDASARIARAALQRNSACHILFEDRICISLSPDFLGGVGGVWDGTEALYQTLLKEIADGRPVPHATLMPKSNLADFLRGMLQPVDVVLDFRENGAMVLGLYQEGPRRPRNALCIIGGVKDIHDEETKVLKQTCLDLRKTRLKVSLGSQAELTSKCMKAVGELNKGPTFANAISHFLSSEPVRPPARADFRPRLHLIVVLPAATSFLQYFEQPGTATMVVDAFVNSHGVYRNMWLSFLTDRGDALTIQSPGTKCLAEADATTFLKEKLRHFQSSNRTLAALLKDSKDSHGRGGQRVLVADETRPVLQQRMDRAAGQPQEQVAVVFVNTEIEREAAIQACSDAGVCFHACANVGGVASGMAYANVLHSAGVLGPCLAAAVPSRHAANRGSAAKPSQAACPSVSRNSRLPADMRPKGSGKLAPWAAGAAAANAAAPTVWQLPSSCQEEASSSSAKSETRSQVCDALPTPTTDPGNTVLSTENGAEHLDPSDAAASSAEPEPEKPESSQPSD
ncbi:unnamed protein product [Symbiodinium natans]|uniref:Uncharacterized protein n=1 Tax=Symbiodinium natans TaxID=878477 RepID=A0A812GEQ2_9DINO|nr:unnamed protein product [Symbiodinium natans]